MQEKEKEELKNSIKSLENERDSLDKSQSEKIEHLNRLINDIKYHLDHPNDRDHAQKLKEKLPDLLKLFEVKHPVITDIINRVSIILSNMGI